MKITNEYKCYMPVFRFNPANFVELLLLNKFITQLCIMQVNGYRNKQPSHIPANIHHYIMAIDSTYRQSELIKM